jgi:branched-chain amino acid aminotransferase
MPALAYFEGAVVPLADAKVGVMTHAFNYGTGCFEGIRGNWNQERDNVFLFRLEAHFKRLKVSARTLMIDLPQSVDELCTITRELVEACGYREDIYVRPIAYKSEEIVGVRLHNIASDFLIFVTPFGNYLDVDAGIHCCVSSWRRIDDNAIPPRAKVTGLYVNSALANILVGITRESVMTLAERELGVQTVERSIARSELYGADEVFLTGTAAHLSPVLSIDRRPIGDGRIGPLTAQLSKLYFDAIRGRLPAYEEWLTPAYPASVPVRA